MLPVGSSAGAVLSDRRKAQPSSPSASTTPPKLPSSSFLRSVLRSDRRADQAIGKSNRGADNGTVEDLVPGRETREALCKITTTAQGEKWPENTVG